MFLGLFSIDHTKNRSLKKGLIKKKFLRSLHVKLARVSNTDIEIMEFKVSLPWFSWLIFWGLPAHLSFCHVGVCFLIILRASIKEIGIFARSLCT